MNFTFLIIFSLFLIISKLGTLWMRMVKKKVYACELKLEAGEEKREHG